MTEQKTIQITGEENVEKWDEAKRHMIDVMDDSSLSDKDALVALCEWFNEGEVYKLVNDES